jgi:hypothetical protein
VTAKVERLSSRDPESGRHAGYQLGSDRVRALHIALVMYLEKAAALADWFLFNRGKSHAQVDCAPCPRSSTAQPCKWNGGTGSGPNPVMPPPQVAFCVWPICLVSRSIGLADTKQPFGVRPATYYLLLNALDRRKPPIGGAAAGSEADKKTR